MRKFYILTIVFALLGISQVWANEAKKEEGTWDSSRDWSGPHASFRIDGENSKDGSHLDVAKNAEQVISWKVDEGCTIEVTTLRFRVGHNGWFVNDCDIYINDEKVETIGTTVGSDKEYGGYKLDNSKSFKLKFSRQIDLYWVEIVYNIIPNTPTVTGSGETAIDVTVDLENKQTVNVKSWFSMENTPKDFTIAYRSSEGGIIEGTNFYATEAGVYTVDAQIIAGDDHNASAWSGDLTITVNHLDQNLVWKNEASVKEPMYIDDEQTMEITASSGLEVAFESSNPEVVSVDANGKLTAKSIGEATITASQAGNKQYNPAESIVRKFTVAYAPQTLSWENEGAIHTSMVLGGEQTIRAIATSGLGVTYESSDENVLSIDAEGNLTANALGTATITASQAGNGKFLPAESITKTFEVKEKETPFFNPDGFSEEGINKLHVEQMVSMEVANVSDNEDLTEGDFTATVSDENVLYVYRDGNVIYIEALAIGKASVTFEQKELDFINGATKTYSFDVRNANEMVLAVDPAEVLELYVDDEIPGLIADQNSDGEISSESSDKSIAFFDVENNVLVVPNSEAKSFDETEVTIAIRQAETDEYQAAEFALTLKISKYDNHVYVTGEQNYKADLHTGEVLEGIYFESEVPDEDKDKVAPIEVKQTSGKQSAVYMEEEQQVLALASEGTALWMISQPESYKYKAASASMRIDVTKMEETDPGYVLANQSDTQNTWHGNTMHEHTWTDEHCAGELTFEISMSGGGIDQGYKAQQLVDGEWQDVTDVKKDYSTSWGIFKTEKLNRDAKGVRIWAKGSVYTYVRNISVTRATYLEAECADITTVPDEEGAGTLKINYSIANGGDLRIVCDNPKFTFGDGHEAVYSVATPNLSAGSANVAVYFTGEEVGKDEEANIQIFNGVYSKIVHLKAHVQDPETAVENIENTERATKILRNGQILILRDGKVYNINGLEVR